MQIDVCSGWWKKVKSQIFYQHCSQFSNQLQAQLWENWKIKWMWKQIHDVISNSFLWSWLLNQYFKQKGVVIGSQPDQAENCAYISKNESREGYAGM
jgi:hypothetical protein